MTDKPTLKKSNAIIEKAINDFKGDIPVLESAIGSLYVGRKYGWKVLYIIHDMRTLKKYEKLLNINFKDILEEVGPFAHKSKGFRIVSKLSNFWKAVKGETPIKDRKKVE